MSRFAALILPFLFCLSSCAALQSMLAFAGSPDAPSRKPDLEITDVAQTNAVPEKRHANPPMAAKHVTHDGVPVSASQDSTPKPNFGCGGEVKQGGLVVCNLPAGSTVFKNGIAVTYADTEGRAAIGLTQSEPASLTIAYQPPNAAEIAERFSMTVAARQDDIRHLDGLECDKLDARTDAQKAHASRSWTKKVAAFRKKENAVSSKVAFQRPAEGPYSSPFGPTRHYKGVSEVTGKECHKTSVHRGLDFATPMGTELSAPMDGIVTLADPDLYYEGGTIFLDHGYGLVSVFMHLSEVDVEPGQVVRAGERIGATGNTGRSTGPHLHWGVKWRPLVQGAGDGFYIDPKLLLWLN